MFVNHWSSDVSSTVNAAALVALVSVVLAEKGLLENVSINLVELSCNVL